MNTDIRRQTSAPLQIFLRELEFMFTPSIYGTIPRLRTIPSYNHAGWNESIKFVLNIHPNPVRFGGFEPVSVTFPTPHIWGYPPAAGS
jgi:hypothetical protein